MPLNWSQVKTDLDPKRFTIRTVPELLKKSTAWQDYCDGAETVGTSRRAAGKIPKGGGLSMATSD